MPNLAERLFSAEGKVQSTRRERGAAWHAQRQQQLQLKARQHHAAGLQGGEHSRGGGGVGAAADDPPAAPSIELAARQFLFDYGTHTGLQILKDRVQDLQVPDVSKTFNLPLVGDFKLELSNIHVVEFNASSEDAAFTILDGNFDLRVTEVDAQIQFQWHWEKLGMQGTGEGELDLHGGSIDFKFRIGTNDQGEPLMRPDDVTSRFASVELHIRSFSADWLYQAVMSLFNEQIQRGIQNGIANALQNDVPNGINKVLATLPTRVDVQGLPFTAEFQWSLYDLTFVMVKGYGMVDTGAGGRRQQRRRLQALAPCPFPSSPLPLSAEQIAAGGGMVTLYLHQSMVNCLSWGLFTSNLMQFDLVDGTIPKLHLTTDLLAMLIPGLPKAYPHQLIRITGEALTQPVVAFDAQGFTLTASYRTSIYVANETAGNPKIVTMAANLTVQGQLNYDSTIITSAVAQHTVEEAVMPVSAPQWDNTVAWFITNYAGLYPLQFLIDKFVQTPVTSLVSLVNAQAATFDGGWYALSGDVLVHPSR